jgi:hypothetical protein
VHVERVIAYWSRSFKGAETRYSTTEREALAAKEALVRFQPYIEGEKILLVTDHSALQWARTYKNSNLRLAAWGAIFSAYAPGLEIVHRPGKKHSNVDPLSRLPRSPPEHQSPWDADEGAISMSNDLVDAQEVWEHRPPAEKATFVAWTLDDCLEGHQSAFAVTRGQKAKKATSHSEPETPHVDAGGGKGPENRHHVGPKEAALDARPKGKDLLTESDDGLDDIDELETPEEYWGATNLPIPNLHISMDEEFKSRFVGAYAKDPAFNRIWKEESVAPGHWRPGQRFFKTEDGLLFFRGADYQP